MDVHPCNQNDKLKMFGRTELNDVGLDSMWNDLFCLDKPQDIILNGGAIQDLNHGTVFQIGLGVKCDGDFIKNGFFSFSNCRDEEEVI